MARGRYYVENQDGTVRVVNDIIEWGQWFETAKRHVGDDEEGQIRVSTVFLGIDHNWMYGPDAVPILYETMVFDGPDDLEQVRYHTREEAENGHARMCKQYLGREPK